jgi:hypothetical protein
MIDKHTFGGTKGGEDLANILSNKYPQLIRKISSYYHQYNADLNSMIYSWPHFQNTSLIELMDLHRQKKFSVIETSNLPEESKSFLLNVMSVSYREKRKIVKNLLKEKRKKGRRTFEVGEKVKVLKDIKDAYLETYIEAGTIVTIKKYRGDQKGYEYGLPYGFYVGADWLEKIKRNK